MTLTEEAMAGLNKLADECHEHCSGECDRDRGSTPCKWCYATETLNEMGDIVQAAWNRIQTKPMGRPAP